MITAMTDAEIRATGILTEGPSESTVSRITPNVYVAPLTDATADFIAAQKEIKTVLIMFIMNDFGKFKKKIESGDTKIIAFPLNVKDPRSFSVSCDRFTKEMCALQNTPVYIVGHDTKMMVQAHLAHYYLTRYYVIKNESKDPYMLYSIMDPKKLIILGIFKMLKCTRPCTHFPENAAEFLIDIEKRMKNYIIDDFETEAGDKLVHNEDRALSIKLTLEAIYGVTLSDTTASGKKHDRLDDIPSIV
jgi:hypothetical protein